jgi:hypothetical protein
MRYTFLAMALLIGIEANCAWSAVVTFQDSLQLNSPAPGWSYLWNSGGPIGNPADYTPLLPNASGDFTTGGVDQRPGPAPGSWVYIGLDQGVPGGHPGEGPLQQSSGGHARYAIAAYTVPTAGSFAIADGWLRNSNPNVTGSTDGMDVKVYAGDALTPAIIAETVAGFDNTVSFAGPLGNLAAGNVIYVAVGPKEIDSFDWFQLRYSIVSVPEPCIAVYLSFIGMACLSSRMRLPGYGVRRIV